MLGQNSCPEEKMSLPFQVEAHQVALSQDATSRETARFLCSALGFTVMLFAVCTLHPHASHASGEASLPSSHAFSPMLGIRPAAHAAIRPAGHVRSANARPAVRPLALSAGSRAVQLRAAASPVVEQALNFDGSKIVITDSWSPKMPMDLDDQKEHETKPDEGAENIGDYGKVLGEFPLKNVKVPQGFSPVAVEVAVGEDKFYAMLDTALSIVAVTPEKAAPWNAERQGTKQVMASSDAKSLEIIRVPSDIRLLGSNSEVALSGIDAMVSDFPQSRMDPDLPVDAMIGLPPLWDRFDVDIDLKAGVLRLYEIGEGTRHAEARNMAALQTSPLPGSNLPAIRVITKDGNAVLGLVDTGSTITIANNEAAEMLIPGFGLLSQFSGEVNIADSGLPLKMAPGVPLALGDKKGLTENKFSAAGEVTPKFIATGDVPALTQFAGQGRPAVLLGLDVLKGKRWLFTGGNMGTDRTLFVE